MFAGERNVRPLLKFNKRMAEFAETDGTLHGAYGHRWRRHFGIDQLARVIKMLRDEPSTRRAVITMWDPPYDLGAMTKKDVPCNTQCYFMLRNDALTMTVTCRSNDMVWGAYGANAVHFSMLHEFIANATGLPMGEMYQFSNNYHVYKEVPKYAELMKFPFLDVNPYDKRGVVSYPKLTQMGEWQTFLEECEKLMYAYGTATITSPFLNDIVVPMIELWASRDTVWLEAMPQCDWKVAFEEWLTRRIAT
jgi:hypothetical protein